MWKVQLFELNYDERESKAIAEVLESGWITMGEKTRFFEILFAEFLGHEVIATAVSSGTAALHMAILALGIGPGDEVIVPALTFVADINVVRLVGATPVLADCKSLSDWNMDPADIARKITPKTKAVMIVHYAGYPCDMDDLQKLCKEHNVYLIEDAAHAAGAAYRGQKCGTFSNIACFSFFTNKNLSIGEGGMYVTRSHELDQRGRYLRSHGMTTLTLDRHAGRAITYDVVQPGLNYRMDEMRAALGIVQLEKLPEANTQRKALVKRYIELLSNTHGISIPFRNLSNVEPAYHIFPVLLDAGIDRIYVINQLKDAGIQSSIHYPSFQDFTAYKGLNLSACPVAQDISHRELTLPLYPTMGFDNCQYVVDTLKDILRSL
jgi:dTDP-4-amino-4,6-dideoxygalactose transaminase